MFGFDPDTLHKIRACFAQFPQIHKVLLYGSRAMGTQCPGSDVDISLIGQDLSRKNTLHPLSEALDELLLPFTFDVSIFTQLKKPELIQHILERGVCLYQAEVVIKAGGEVKKLEEVCDFQNGFAFKSKTFRQSGTPLVRITNIQNNAIGISNAVFIDRQDYDIDLSRYEVIEGDLLIAMSGATTGKIGINKNTDLLLLNQRVGKFKPRPDLLKSFLFYFLTTKAEENLAISAGAAQPNLSTEQIKNFEIPVPPLAEQESIVALLDKAFAAIDQAKSNLETNIANAKELFQSKLNDIFAQKGDGWVETTLPDASNEFGRGKSKHRPRNAQFLYGGPYPFVQTGDIRNSGQIISSFEQTYTEEGLAQSKLWPSGTICITIAANIAETGILGFDGCFPDSVIGMIPNPKLTSAEYVEYLLRFFKVELQALGKGAAQDNINLGTFKNRKFPFAPLPQQRAIVKHLDALSESTKQLKSNYQTKLTALDELKKSILQKAFNGELTE